MLLRQKLRHFLAYKPPSPSDLYLNHQGITIARFISVFDITCLFSVNLGKFNNILFYL